MLKLKGIDHINLNVRNVEETIEFYKRIFGFEVKEEGVSPISGNKYAIIGKSDKGLLAIYEDKNFDENNDGKLNHLGFFIEDFDSAYEYLQKENVRIADYGIVDYPASKSLYIFDPNGVEIELSSSFGGGL